MRDSSRTAVSAEVGLGLVGPEHMIVPLMASLYYRGQDPYAIRIAFHVGTGEPVEWTLARELLAAALEARAGIGDVQAWPSAAADEGSAAGAGEGAAAGAGEWSAAGQRILNIAMSSPFGHAQFEVNARAVEEFLWRTYEIVPAGQESGFLDFDAELTELLSQALQTRGRCGRAIGPAAGASPARLRARHQPGRGRVTSPAAGGSPARLQAREDYQAVPEAGGTTGGTMASIRCGPGSAYARRSASSRSSAVVTQVAGTPRPLLIWAKLGVGSDRSSIRAARSPGSPAAVRASSIRRIA
jgi:hypothetical protein